MTNTQRKNYKGEYVRDGEWASKCSDPWCEHQHIVAPLVSDEWRKPRNKKRQKLAKTFCRGIEGRAHDFILKRSPWANGRPCGPAKTGEPYWRGGCSCMTTCANCGKRVYSRAVPYCAEYYANAHKQYAIEQETRMAAFRAKYHIKPETVEKL